MSSKQHTFYQGILMEDNMIKICFFSAETDENS